MPLGVVVLDPEHQAHGVADAVQISAASREQVSGALACQARGTVEIKGKGPMPTFWLEAARARADA